MEVRPYYEQPTEDPSLIKDILEIHEVKPRVVLTPVGGYPWPIFFAEEFPNTEIVSFDNNPRQIQEFKETITDTIGSQPLYLDISNTKNLSDILDRKKIDFVFLSNIPDYLDLGSIEEIVEVITEQDVEIILISSMGDGNIEKGYEPEGYQTFVDLLKENGYVITLEGDNGGRFEVKQFCLARKKK